MGFSFDPDQILKTLENLKESAIKDLDLYTATAAADFESYAKENKPWTNRTGEAQRRLKGTSTRSDDYVYNIELAHGVEYGKDLENKHERKYAIIEPTLLTKSPDVMQGFDNYINKISSKL